MSRQGRWKQLAALSAVLGVGIVSACLLVGKMQERKDYVGRVDEVSGYRCRFTLSATWRKYDGPSQEGVEDDSFCPAPPNPIISWIALRLFHHVLPPGNSPTIALMRLQPSAQMFHVRDGYLEMAWVNPSSPDIRQRHLRIDGFPATVVTQTLKDYRGTWLIVYMPNCPVVYVVTACDTSANMGQTNHEMEAIISSFHVEKVSVPTGGK